MVVAARVLTVDALRPLIGAHFEITNVVGGDAREDVVMAANAFEPGIVGNRADLPAADAVSDEVQLLRRV
jgi:hypothetical protein